LADTRSTEERNAARSRAQKYFTASEQRNAEIKQTIENERSAMDARIAKLRALRLAKEEADREAAANTSPVEPTETRTPKSRQRKT
jgi:hypothetical protein